jgi:kumamolisin
MPEGGGRLLPDVAGYASVEKPGYQIYLDNRFNTSGGTSAVAPLYAALFALINEKLEKVHKENPNKYKRTSVGCINKLLYELGKNGKGYQQGILNEITKGNNTTPSKKGYKATPGWDACTGWGTINGGKLLEYLLENKN